MAFEPIGTRVMCSTPPAMTTSYWPAITPIAAKLAACCPEPHIRSSVVPQTSTGKPAISAALRAMLNPCSPTWSTQPRMTRSEEHTSELQSPCNLVCRLLLEKKKENYKKNHYTH